MLIGPPEGGHYEQLRRALATAEIVAEDDRLGDLLLRLAPLPALTLDGQVGFFLGQPEVALQDALGAVEVFPERLETQEAAALVKSRSRNSIPSALARSAAGGPPGDETFE